MMTKSTFALFFLVATALVQSEVIRSFRPLPINRTFKTVPRSNLERVVSPKEAALSFAKRQLKITDRDFVVKNVVNTKHNGITHVYLRQIINGKEISNADFNVNVSKDGSVISYGSTFLPVTPKLRSDSESLVATTKFVKPAEAFKALASYMKESPVEKISERVVNSLEDSRPQYELVGIPFAQGNVKAEQAYIQNSKGELIPSWRFVVKTKSDWLNAHVRADGSEVVAVSNWMNEASYKVIGLGDSDPEQSERKVIKEPHSAASPQGWHSGKSSSKDKAATGEMTTIGNNVYAQENWSGGEEYLDNHRPAAADGNFEFEMDLKKGPKTYIDAAVTNLFYWNNILHDISYAYGFDEEAGNFQKDNFDKGGKGNDYVIANAQDGSRFNNAGFATPPDGENGWMLMYIFNAMRPNRDGDLVSDIISHEFTHGISNRLTGGPANTDCLKEFESGSMGEGWGDFFGISLKFRESDTKSKNFGVGKYINKGKTIRSHEYSTDMEVNPLTYKSLNEEEYQEVHAGGVIWANTLYEMYWALREATGKFNEDVYSADKTAGNTLAIQLVIDGMKLQPCSPTFLQARDAILQAEKAATEEKYKCAIWKAFSKRGMGPKAESHITGEEVKVTADFDLPSECQEEGGETRKSKFSLSN